MKKALSISNPNPRRLPGPQLLHELVPRESRHGTAAVEHTTEDGSVTRLQYAELHQQAEALARRIAEASRGCSSQGNRFIVPILIPQSLNLYISELASLKAGAAFCPIVLDAPEERIRFILQDTGAKVLLTTRLLQAQLPPIDGIEVIAVDDGHQSIETTSLRLQISPKDAAYVMYTSGSTGQPKGVVISHAAATQALLAHDKHLPKFSRFLQFASPTFDVSVFEIFFPWFRHSTLISCDRKRLLNDLPAVINDLGIDACELTPSVASSLLRGRSSVPSLKVLLTIGEMLKPSVVDEFGGSSSEVAVLHGMYGPTEATIHCTLQPAFPKEMVCGMIGLPLETVSAFVVKAHEEGSGRPPVLDILELGEEGELAVGGYQLADGYLNRDEQTKAAFVEHSKFGLLYRTGDRAKMLPDGRLECLGRISSGQVKLRGQRIELGEIEHAASRTSGCRDVVAEVIQGILVVFCVRENSSVSKSMILTTCQAWLPSFMVPGEVIILDALPYLASGKCDRKALREQYPELQVHLADGSANQNDIVRHVNEIISDVLGLRVGSDSALVRLGVDSLSAIRIAAALRKAGYPQLDATQVLNAHTALDIASILESNQLTQQSVGEASYRSAIDRALLEAMTQASLANIEDSFPCTPIQVAMLAETHKQSDAYCNWVEFEVSGVVDISIVARALDDLSHMHPMLRSGFVPITNTQWSYATVIWKKLNPDQVRKKTTFEYEFTMRTDADLLRPCSFQLKSVGGACQILLRAHHSMFDQWSIDLLRVDLAGLLEGRQIQRPSSFKLVADWHDKQTREGLPTPAMDFWQQTLRGVTPSTLPVLRAQQASTRLCRTRWRELSFDTSVLKAQARQLNCSTPSILQVAWALLLGSYTGSSDVVFGSVFSGRNVPIQAIDTIFGPCLATLPLRIDTATANSCADLAGALTERNRAMQAHVSVPSTSIRAAAGIAPGVTFFDTLFVWQETTFHNELQGRSVQLVDSMDQLEFNLVLEFDPTPSKVKIRATYQQSLFDSDQVDMLLRQIDGLASAIINSPNCSIKDVWTRVGPDLLSIVNPDPESYSDKFELTSVIERYVAQHPSAPAIVFAEHLSEDEFDAVSLSYSELDARANRMAHHFIASGLKPEGLVCICMEKSIDLYVAMLASFKAGAGYLPLTIETPAARVKAVLAQTTIDLCVCDANTMDMFERFVNAPVLNVSKAVYLTFPNSAPAVVQFGSRVAYAVFTSGSTGEPKGVAVTMDNLKGNLGVLGELYKVQSGDRLLQACSQAFDVSVFEIFFAFYSGMCLCTATKDVMFNDFEQSIKSFQATHLSLTPTVAALVRPENIPSVKFLVTAGEGITEKVHRLWSGKGLHQGYGPSETTNICSVKMHHSPHDFLGNIGPPFRNTSAFVLSVHDEFSILPAGAYGEFAFGGEQVFRGYIGRDDLNSVKIIDHPKYGRVYKSGDMGRILPDGTLLIAGRRDDQVKIRGNRIELGEINAIVSNHPNVLDCTTLVLGEGSSKQVLVTYFVPKSPRQGTKADTSVVDVDLTTVSEIFSRLEDALPTYMMPSTLVPLNRLPITSQGKLDKQRLRQTLESLENSTRDQFSRSHEVSSGDVAASPIEQTLAHTLSDVLDVPLTNISRDTSFFALGLNSLNAMQYAKSLQKKIGVAVSVSAVLKHASIARLAAAIPQFSQHARHSKGGELDVFSDDCVRTIRSALAERGLSDSAILPCTPLQQAMLSASVTDGSEAYCNTTRLRVVGDMARLRTAWNSMMERHTILRTSFVETSSAAHPFAQVVLRNPPEVWHNIRKDSAQPNGALNGHANGNSNGHVASTSRLPAVSPTSPLSIHQDGCDLYLQMHHAIYDGISVSNLFNEIQEVYLGHELPAPVPFEPFLVEVMRQDGTEARQFWTEKMRDFYPRPFPVPSSVADHQEAIVDKIIPWKPSDLRSFCEKHSFSVLSVFQAAWAKTLACAQQATDVCFGNVLSGRSVFVADVDRLVAPCFNTVPLRSRLDGLRTNLALIQSLHQSNIDTLPFQLTSSRHIQALSGQPSVRLFDSLLLLQPQPKESDLWTVEEDSMDMGIPLAVELIPGDGMYELVMHYLPNMVSHTLASALADAFIAALSSCLRYPSNGVEHLMDFDSARISGQPRAESISSGQENGKTDMQDSKWTDTEEIVRTTFSRLADVDPERISKKTSLYQIGLDSLNAVQVASRLRRQGFELDAADVMQYQTPAGLAAFLNSKQTNNTSHDSAFDLMSFDRAHRGHILKDLQLHEHSVEAILPCTPAQRGMLAQFLQSEGNYYMSHSVYEIPEGVTFDAVKAAWKAVQRKHKVLRMGFYQMEDATVPFAMIVYKAEESFGKADLSTRLAEEASFEQTAKKDVLAALHLPAWRMHLKATNQGRIMCLSLHHALYDADSLQVLLTDFARAIRGTDLGAAPSIEQVLASQLSGASQSKKSDEKFWSEALESARVVKFPNLTPTIATEGASKCIQYCSEVTIGTVETFCRTNGVTVQSLGQGVWAMLLAQYLGEPDVTFGTVFSGVLSTAHPAAFPTISTLPVHCNAKKDTDELLLDMVSYNASIQRHRSTPLADIQRYAGSAGQALFDTIFVYQKPREHAEDDFDWNAIIDDLGIDYVASMEMEIPGSGLVHLRLTYDTKSIPVEHASLMVEQYDMILCTVLSGSRQDPIEKVSLTSFVPPKQSTIPCSVSLLHQFVERGARNHPGRPALEFIHSLDGGKNARKKWTYKQLDQRSNQVAQLIQHHAVVPGSIIAVCMTKCAEATFAFVGILKAGCAFLAMDPDLPLARRSFIVEDSQSQLLFVNAGKTDPEMQKVVRSIELTEDSLMQHSGAPVSVPTIEPSATSYCLYTSGTTGTPKGCELSHENAVQAMMSFQRLFAGHWDQNSRWLQFASYWFDVSVLEQFWSWSVGVTVVGAPRDVVLEDLAAFIQEANITHIDLTPSLARLLTPEEVPSLHNHVFITGGEALKQEIIDRWGPFKTICNGYGPTEATIGVTMNPFIDHTAKPSNIGPPFDNVGAYVFAPGTDQLVMRGAVGELCVSGKLVGKGYLNRPDLTAKAFPYLERHGERVYRTGDLVRLLADDSVSFIGRADTQAKLRGQRLEIDEIDSVIKSSATAISDVASLVVKSNEGNREMLVSFIVDDTVRSRGLQVSNSDPSLKLVQTADEACRDRLPGYMVPTHIIPLTRLPLTVNNKVDTKRLVALFSEMTTQDLQQLKGSRSATRELSQSEQSVAQALARLLSIEVSDITPGSNFFSLGLSSVSAITFATALKRNGLKGTSVAMIMRHPTVQGLCKATAKDDDQNQIERNAIKQAQLTISAFSRRHRGAVSKALDIDATEIESIAPCTPLQEGLLVESIKGHQQPYFNQFWYDVTALGLDRLVTAIERLCELVGMLRTVFLSTDEGFAQVVLRKHATPVHTAHLTNGSTEGFLGRQKQEWLESVTSEILRPFRALIVRTSDSAVLAFHAHHALYDGISWDLTMDRLKHLYESDAAIDSGPSFNDALPHGPLCLRPDARDFWQHRIEGTNFVPLSLLSDKSSFGGLIKTKRLRFNSQLETVRRQLALSHQAVLQAAFAIALHQFSPQTQSYGVVLSGRSISFDGAREVIGPLFNTVPYALDIQSSDQWKQLLLRCQQSNAAIVPFQHTSLRDIKKICGRHSSDPMFDVLFVFQRSETSETHQTKSLFKPIETQTPAEYPLAVEIELEGLNDIVITAAAQGKYVTGEGLDKLMQDIEKALHCMAENVDQALLEDFSIEYQQTHNADTVEMNGIPRSDGAQDFEWTPEGSRLRGMIAQLAGCQSSDVTEHTGIFTLGLDSIDAVKLGSQLKKAGLAIPVSQILKAQTIPNMLEALRSEENQDAASSPVTRLSNLEEQLQTLRETFDEEIQASIERILPVTPGQEALIADMIRSDFRRYYNSDILQLNDGVDTDRMRAAWQAVVDTSPILRTSFVEVPDPDIDAIFAQVVHRPAKIHFMELPTSSLKDLDEYMEQVRIDAQATMANELPCRLALATVQGKKYLILSMAHAQYDGHSLSLLHEDISKAYTRELERRPDYDSMIGMALNATNKEALRFWKDTLNGARISRISQSEDLPTGKTHRAERAISVTVSEARDFCKEHGVSLQALTQASWALLLGTYVKQLEILFGIVLACRDSEESEAVMFPTMNTVPMRALMHGTGSDMVRYVQSMNNDARPYQRTPLRTIQSACAGTVQMPSSNLQGGLFDTLFIYQQRPQEESQGRQPLYESVRSDSNVEYAVAIEAEAVGDGLIVRVACKSHVLDERGTRSLLQKFDHVLNYLVNSPDKQAVEFTGDFVSICGLPSFRLQNDALDRFAKVDVPTSEFAHAEFESPFEAAIRSALAQVARVQEEDVSPDTKMETIGIDSVSAIKVTALLRKESIRLPVSSIIKAQTPKRMAELVESNSATPPQDKSSAEIIKAFLSGTDLTQIAGISGNDIDNVESVMPATAGQLYMLSMWRKTDGELFYPMFKYRIKNQSGVEEIQSAWDQVVSRNPVLRTVLVQGRSQTLLLQVVLKQSTKSSNQPMAHLQLEKIDGGHLATLKIHHALYDAVSLPLLMRELELGIAGGTPPDPRIKFQDYVAIDLSQEAQRSKKSFWIKYLRDVQLATLEQPKFKATRKVQVFKPRAFMNCSDLERYCRSSGITVQALLFAVYAKAYASQASRADDVVFGIYLANRSHLPDLDRLAAPTLNLLPLLVGSPKARDLLDLAKKIDADLKDIGSAEASGASLAEIANWTSVKVDSFVNFLKLPEQSEKQEEQETVIEAIEEWTEECSRVVEPETPEGDWIPQGLRDSEPSDAYQHAVDVEISMANGELSIGLFCLEEMLNLEKAEHFIAEMQRGIESVVQ